MRVLIRKRIPYRSPKRNLKDRSEMQQDPYLANSLRRKTETKKETRRLTKMINSMLI